MNRWIRSWMRIVVGGAVLAGCRAEPGGSGAAAPAEARDDDENEDNENEGGSKSPLAMSPLAEMFAKKLGEPGPYEAPKESEDFDAQAPHWAVLELSRPVSELETMCCHWRPRRASARAIDRRLHEPRQGRHAPVGLSSASSRGHLSCPSPTSCAPPWSRSRPTGAKLASATPRASSNATYYLLTACDRSGWRRSARSCVAGPAATPVHLKGLLDKLGIQADFLHVGAFKGAAEPLTRDAPSPEMIETLEAILDQRYADHDRRACAGRRASPPRRQVAAMDDRPVHAASAAERARLVDEVATWEAFLRPGRRRRAGRRTRPARTARWRPLPRPARSSACIRPSARPRPTSRWSTPSATSSTARAQGVLGAREEIASRTLVAALRALAADDERQGGGPADRLGGRQRAGVGADWHAVHELEARKPVVVSMGAVAASGGYYIAAGATEDLRPQRHPHRIDWRRRGQAGVRGRLAELGVKTYRCARASGR